MIKLSLVDTTAWGHKGLIAVPSTPAPRLKAGSDDNKLKKLCENLKEAVDAMSAEAILEMALDDHDQQALGADSKMNTELQEKVAAMGGISAIDPEDAALMAELTAGLPMDLQVMRGGLTSQLGEMKAMNEAILAALQEGPWDVIRNLEVRAFYTGLELLPVITWAEEGLLVYGSDVHRG